LIQDPIEGLPPFTILCIPKLKGFFQMIRSVMAEIEKEIRFKHLTKTLGILGSHRRAKGRKEGGQAWSALLLKILFALRCQTREIQARLLLLSWQVSSLEPEQSNPVLERLAHATTDRGYSWRVRSKRVLCST